MWPIAPRLVKQIRIISGFRVQSTREHADCLGNENGAATFGLSRGNDLGPKKRIAAPRECNGGGDTGLVGGTSDIGCVV